MQNIFKRIHSLTHFSNVLQLRNILLLATVINKAQEISLTISNDNQNNSNISYASNLIFSSVMAFIKYCFALSSVSSDQFILIIIAFFIIHVTFISLFIYLHITNNLPGVLMTIMNAIIIYYALIFHIPTFYASLTFIYNGNICTISEFCSDSERIVLIMVCIFNIIFSLIMIIITVYFGRCENLMEDNNILMLDIQIIIRALVKSLVIIAIILKSIEELQVLRFICLISKYCIYFILTINKINYLQFSILELSAFIINLNINFKLSIYELFLMLTLGISLIFQLRDSITNYFIVQRKQENLSIIQILAKEKQIGDKKSLIILATMKKIHNCVKCKVSSQMTECLLRKMSNIKDFQQQTSILIYSNFISNYAPLKALIKVIVQVPNEIYFLCAYPNLSQKLFQIATQIQYAQIHKSTVRNTGEHIASLDVEQVFNTSNSSGILFPIMIETLQGKINFWSKLINGYSDIDHFLAETLRITQKMQKCRKEMENRYDLESYKLKTSSQTDILSMRIIQIYYASIYSSSFQAYQLEKSIEDLMKNERYRQDESLDNIQLVQNRLIILRSSLIRNRGELINVNVKQLSQFFLEDEDNLKGVKHCNHLMPPFLSAIHDDLMDNYLYRGYSKLMIHGESTFYQTTSGYIEQGSINLFNYFDEKNDFVLNMIITKQQANNETIIFGVDGKILGISRLFFDEVVRNQFQLGSQTLKSTQKDFTPLQISNFISKNPLIQCFIPDIQNQVEELRVQIQSTQNYLTNNLKSSWQVPSSHNDWLLSSYQILLKFQRKNNEQHINSEPLKSQTFSKYSYNSHFTQVDGYYDDSDFSSDIKNKIVVDGIPLILLHPDVQESLLHLMSNVETQPKLNQISLFYNLQFKTLSYKKGISGYFIMTIKDFKNQANFIGNQQTSQGSTLKILPPSQEFSSNSKGRVNDVRSEIQESEEIYIQEVKLMNNLNDKVREAIEYGNSSQIIDNSFKFQIKQSDRSNLFDSGRQPLFAKPRLLDHQVSNDVEQIEHEMQMIKELKLDDIEEEQEGEERKMESKSQSVKKNSNLLEKFRTKLMLSKEKGVDFASNPSRTSTNSTSKESLLIVQQLYYNTQLIVPLRKISFLFFLIWIGILIINILNVSLITQNLTYQMDQLAILRQPQNINYFYSSEVMHEIYQYLQKYSIVTLSPFTNQRNIDTLQGMYDYARLSMISLAIIVPELAKQQGLATQFITTFLINGKIIEISYPLEDYYNIIYEITEESYRESLANNTYSYPEILPTGVVRLNLLKMVDFHNNIIVTLISYILTIQESVKSYFLSVMIGELFSLLLLLGIALRYWLFIDHIVKSILFLVSRLNENQALEQINKFMILKEQLENQTEGNWKLFNFGEIMYGFSEKKAKKIVLKQNAVSASNNVKASSALYSRIQRTYYLNRNNAILIFFISISWTAFLMAGFLIHMAKNDNFQPSLTVTLKFVQFRHNMDSLLLLAGLIKSEPQLPNTNLSYLNQSYACQLLIQYKENLSPLINDAASVILENANAKNEKSRFDALLNSDLCLASNLSVLPLCDVSQITLGLDKKDFYLDIISNGVLGYTAAVLKFINQEFDYEIQHFQYNPDLNEGYETINTKQFQNFILQYFSDIQNVMRQFLVLFQTDNTSIANDIISIIQVYYFGFGTCLFVAFIVLSILWIYQQQTKIQSLRQILVLIPPDHILTTNVRSQAKAIHSMLY